MPDRGGGDAQCGEVVEPSDAGAVAPDPGIVEDRRRHPELSREVSGIETAMRAVDDDCALRLGANPGDAVGGQDRCWRRRHVVTSADADDRHHAVAGGRAPVAGWTGPYSAGIVAE